MLKLLIVEDNEMNQILISKFLEKLGYKSDIARNGLEAIKLIEKNKYNLIFMDIMMPLMNGLICTQKLRSHSNKDVSKLPIIGISANKENETDAIIAGMDYFIGKPISIKKLELVIEKHLK